MKFKLTDTETSDDAQTVIQRNGVRIAFTGSTYETSDKAEIDALKATPSVEQVRKRDESNDS